MLGQAISAISNAFGIGGLFGRSGLATPGNAVARLEQAAFDRYGPPREAQADDRIVSEIVIVPYNRTFDLGNYGRERPQDILEYRYQARRNPVVHSALFGAQAAAAVSDATILPNRHGPRDVCNEVADFVKWTLTTSNEQIVGILDNLLATLDIDGYTICAKKMKPVWWSRSGRTLWGFDHTRQLDTQFIALQLDLYRNPISIVNFVRGMEYYSPNDVILLTNKMQYNDPFGTRGSACIRGQVDKWDAAFKAWEIAVTVFGLPYMHGQYGDSTRKQALFQALEALRGGGFIVTDKEDDIEIMNMAGAAGTGMFKDMAQVTAENIFTGLRGAAKPFMEGDGGNDAHGDTEVEQDSSDAWTKHKLLKCAAAIQHQLIPDLVIPNWGNRPELFPTIRFGGLNWEHIEKVVSVLADAKEKLGVEISKEFAAEKLNLPEPRNPEDKLDAGKDEGKEDTTVIQGVAALQAQVVQGAIPLDAARGNLMVNGGYSQEEVMVLLPDSLKPPPQPTPGTQPGAAPQPSENPTAAPEASAFSADYRPAWQLDAERVLAEFRSKA